MALATLLAAGMCACAGRVRVSHCRHCAYATGCAATSETSSSFVPGRATSTNSTGTRYSPTMRRPGIVARASCAVETPPSIEFSIAIIAASDRPSTTSASASPTLRTGRQMLLARFGHLRERRLGEGAGRPEVAVGAAGGGRGLGVVTAFSLAQQAGERARRGIRVETSRAVATGATGAATRADWDA